MSYQDQFMNVRDTSFHMVIRPCAKYGKLLLNQKKLRTRHESAQKDEQPV